MPETSNLILQWRSTTRSNKRSAGAYTRPHRLRRSHPRKGPCASLKNPTLKMAAVQALPKDVSKLGQDVKLFGKWDTQECVMLLMITSSEDS